MIQANQDLNERTSEFRIFRIRHKIQDKFDLIIPPMLYSVRNYNILILHINSRKLEKLGVIIALSKSVTRFGSALAINSAAQVF